MHQLTRILDSFHTRLAPYDDVRPLARTAWPDVRLTNRLAFLLLVVFMVGAAVLIFGGLVDNKPTTASTGLVTAHRMCTLNLGGWFTEGIWWREKQTPTPLPFTIHGLFFAVFGYSVRGILALHVLVGAVAAGLLYRITTRRYGPWTGLLAMGCFLLAPLPLYVMLSGWTFVWATMFLLLAIELLDNAVLAKRIPWYLLAGLVLGCAGMSRPENYAVAAVVVVFVNIPLRYRLAFVVLAFLYPLAQYAHNNLYLGDAPGLRILDDARSDMSYATLFEEWAAKVHRAILNRNFMPLFQWLLLPAVLFFGVPRHRFLTSILAYFCMAFFAAYAMRRISFNHEGYYFAHVTLAWPFLAALLAWTTGRAAAMCQRVGLGRRPAWCIALFLLAGVLLANTYTLRRAYAERVFFRVPDPVREVRDYLQRNLEPDDRIALDYFTEVSWMIAEIEGPNGRDLYFYNTNPSGTPRPPVNAARKGIPPEDEHPMNAWVGENYRQWREEAPPDYLVTQTDAAWVRERDRDRKDSMGHYRMYSLRPALGVDTARDTLLSGTVVLENDEFLVIKRDETTASERP